jgi:hypothetical protein
VLRPVSAAPLPNCWPAGATGCSPAITRNTNAGLDPEIIARKVVGAIERPYRLRRPIGQATLLSWLRRLMPAGMFEPSLRKAFALDPSRKVAGNQPSNQR